MAKLTPENKSAQPHFLRASPSADSSSLLDHFNGFAVTTDRHGRIVYANRAAMRISGLSQSEITGQSLALLFGLTTEQKSARQPRAANQDRPLPCDSMFQL